MQSGALFGLLPVLIAGYVFNLLFYPARFFSAQADGQRLFFMSAASGLLLATIAFLAQTRLMRCGWVRNIDEYVSSAIPVLHATPLLLLLLLAPTLALVLNLIAQCLARFFVKEKLTAKECIYASLTRKHGSPLVQLMHKAVDAKLVLLSLKPRKIYCGWIIKAPASMDSGNSYVELLPKFSAHRDKDSLEMSSQIDYPVTTLMEAKRFLVERRAVRKKLSQQRTEKAADTDAIDAAIFLVDADINDLETTINDVSADSSFNIEDWVKVFPVSEIESASLFDQDTFHSWFIPRNHKGRPSATRPDTHL